MLTLEDGLALSQARLLGAARVPPALVMAMQAAWAPHTGMAVPSRSPAAPPNIS